MNILCERCAKEFDQEDIQDCACGLPFCDECYEYHVYNCPDTLEALGMLDADTENGYGQT